MDLVAASFVDIYGYVTAALALLAVGGIVAAARQGHGDRDEEDAARAFFDRHGHWPDEQP